jgi:hypothetical protein
MIEIGLSGARLDGKRQDCLKSALRPVAAWTGVSERRHAGYSHLLRVSRRALSGEEENQTAATEGAC